jgi:hypothetical protein
VGCCLGQVGVEVFIFRILCVYYGCLTLLFIKFALTYQEKKKKN